VNALALPRLLTRRRHRKPRPPWWWVCVVMLALAGLAALWDALDANWVSLASMACNLVIWWTALHSPPRYWNQRVFWRWWPPGMALGIVGLVWQ
jgi:drug/metabolite transporter (DMT)-like permease